MAKASGAEADATTLLAGRDSLAIDTKFYGQTVPLALYAILLSGTCAWWWHDPDLNVTPLFILLTAIGAPLLMALRRRSYRIRVCFSRDSRSIIVEQWRLLGSSRNELAFDDVKAIRRMGSRHIYLATREGTIRLVSPADSHSASEGRASLDALVERMHQLVALPGIAPHAALGDFRLAGESA